jgi:tripartite-type tricarboxylate transporter receptor subunit TctC
VIVVNISSPAKTLQEFIALVKSRPGKMTYGSSGSGSSNHLTGAMLMSAAQLNMVHVPYKGGAPGMVALLSNEVDMMVAQIPSSKQLHTGGKSARTGNFGREALAGDARCANDDRVGASGL